MQGEEVTRIAGWDTHGLPVEIEVEKELKLSGKKDIETVRRGGVQRPRAEERASSTRPTGRRSPTGSATGSTTSIRTSPAATSTSRRCGGCSGGCTSATCSTAATACCRTAPAAARCSRATSSRSGYEEVTTNSVYVTFPLADDPSRQLLIWTTTPWTLLSNVAVAAQPGPRVRRVPGRRPAAHPGHRPRRRAAQQLGQGRADLRRAGRGAHLPGPRAGRAPLPASARGRAAARGPGQPRVVVLGDFVTAEDGSGLVHMAPAFGADDFQAGVEHGLALVRPVAADGTFVGHDLARDRGPAGHGARDQRPHHPAAQAGRPLAPDASRTRTPIRTAGAARAR